MEAKVEFREFLVRIDFTLNKTFFLYIDTLESKSEIEEAS
jgi:hypothetical protein